MLRRILKAIDTISEWSGKAVAWLLLLLVIELMYDIIARYAFNAPTKWSYDISWMIGALVYIFGASYVLAHRCHVRVDVLYTRYKPKAKLIYDTVLMLVFFFTAVSIWLMGSINATIFAVRVGEISAITMWHIPLFPLRIIISFGIALLLLQGIVTVIRDVSSLLGHELSSEMAERKS